METMLQNFGGFQLGVILGELILPVQCESTQTHQGTPESQECACGHLVQTGEQGRLAFNFPAAEGPLDQLEGPLTQGVWLVLVLTSRLSPPVALSPFRSVGVDRGGRRRGNQDVGPILSK